MNDYQNPLYRREIILKHYHNPIYKTSLDKNRFPYFIASHCGDSLILDIDINDNIINKVNFDGYGCAIMIAATDIILQFIKKRDTEE
ncbi:MAG: hypothetical protein E7Y34_02050, partial [Mycoplasma sp.]|nr:hypothetical protein [Mycoplasma sp.]